MILIIIEYQASDLLMKALQQPLDALSSETLTRKVRYAEEHNHPKLIRQFLERPFLASATRSEQQTKAAHREYLVAQFQLLMETMADECLPPHWRRSCLDHLYLPLKKLEDLSDCQQSKRQVLSLINELRVMSHYLQAGLSI